MSGIGASLDLACEDFHLDSIEVISDDIYVSLIINDIIKMFENSLSEKC